MYIWDTGSYISIYVVLTYNINNIKYTNMHYVSFSNYFQIIYLISSICPKMREKLLE